MALDKNTGIFNPNAGIISQTTKTNLCKVIKTVKQKYYINVIDILDHQKIFQAVKWPLTTYQYTTPSIQCQDGSLAINNLEK